LHWHVFRFLGGLLHILALFYFLLLLILHSRGHLQEGIDFVIVFHSRGWTWSLLLLFRELVQAKVNESLVSLFLGLIG